MSPQSKRVKRMENEEDETTAKKNFASLPVQLRELVLSKTDTKTRTKLFQINNGMREWALKEELFGEDLKKIEINEPVAWITPRYGGRKKISVLNQYVFKVVRRCKQLVLYDWDDEDLNLTRVFPRLQSINHFEFRGTDCTRLSQMFMGNAQVTEYFHFNPELPERGVIEEMAKKNGGSFLQFIENHLKRCKTVHFGEYPLEELFDFLGTQHFPQAIFKDLDSDDLEMLLSNGIPILHQDSTICMIIWAELAESSFQLIEIFDIISKETSVVMENEAIEEKFLDSYEKVGGPLISGPLEASGPSQFINDPSVECIGLKRKFDEERNLIFLVHRAKDELGIHIHIKFDPIEE